MALISVSPPGMWYHFWFTIFLDRDGSIGFQLAFSTITVQTPQLREPMWEFCQLLKMSLSIMHLGIEEIIHSGTMDPR